MPKVARYRLVGVVEHQGGSKAGQHVAYVSRGSHSAGSGGGLGAMAGDGTPLAKQVQGLGMGMGMGMGMGTEQGLGQVPWPGPGQVLGVGAPPLPVPAEPLWYRVRDAEVACVGWEEVRGAQALLLMYVQEHSE